LLVSATTDQISTPTPVTPSGPINALPTLVSPTSSPLEQPAPSVPPSLDSLFTATLTIRPVDQLTVSGTTSTDDGVDLWEQAYEIFRKQEPDLINEYNKHLLGDTAVSADLSSRDFVEIAVKKLLEDREKKQWKITFRGRDIKIRTQVERLSKFLRWSDPIVKDAVSAQPYAALAWSAVSLLLPVSGKQAAVLL
jgi:hypothetical protein